MDDDDDVGVVELVVLVLVDCDDGVEVVVVVVDDDDGDEKVSLGRLMGCGTETCCCDEWMSDDRDLPVFRFTVTKLLPRLLTSVICCCEKSSNLICLCVSQSSV